MGLNSKIRQWMHRLGVGEGKQHLNYRLDFQAAKTNCKVYIILTTKHYISENSSSPLSEINIVQLALFCCLYHVGSTLYWVH